MRLQDQVYNVMLDAATSLFGGKVMRFYTGNTATVFGTAPTGTVLAEITLPTPPHNAAGYNANALNAAGQVSAAFEAAISGAWQDISANAGGAIGCFAVFNGTTVMADGSAGTGTKDIVTSLASVATGAVFTVSKWTWQLRPAASA